MKTKRILALMLALLMLLPLFIACKKDAANGAVDGSASGESTVDTSGYEKDNIPADLNYGGEEVTILGWTGPAYDFYEKDLGTSVIEQAVVKRNVTVETRLGVDIKHNVIAGGNADMSSYIQHISNSVASGQSDYDLISSYSMCGVSMATQNLLTNMSGLPYLEFNKPWWNQTLVGACKIGNGMYFCSGDLAVSSMLQTFLVAVNMDTLAQHPELQDPRQMVKDGTWTYEAMFEMTAGLGKDNNNNGKDISDNFGLIAPYPGAAWDMFFTGSGLKFISVNRDGKYDLDLSFESEKTYNIIQYLNKQLSTDNVYTGDKNHTNATYDLFAEGRSLFAISEFEHLLQNKESIQFTYSFVPTPKYDKEQKNYNSALGFEFSMYSIPSNASDSSMSAAVLECMESESYRQLRPAVYEGLKYQQSNEILDAEMFDYIIGCITYDLGRIMHGQFESTGNYSASPMFIFRRGVLYGENFYRSVASYKNVINSVIKGLNDFAAEQ